MPRSKFTADSRLMILREIENGVHTVAEESRLHQVHTKTIKRWQQMYTKDGIGGITERKANVKYTENFKLKVVKLFLSHTVSAADLTIRFGLRTDRLISNWVKKYNESGKIEASPKKRWTPRMARSTTFDERVKIVTYCLDNGRHLTATATKFNVTYQQVRNWVVKFEAGGEEALRDNRGHHKTDDQLTEVERLRRKVSRLESELRDERAINLFAKKLQALRSKKP